MYFIAWWSLRKQRLTWSIREDEWEAVGLAVRRVENWT